MKLSRPSRSLERIALGLGLVSSTCLAIAAFAAFGNPREAGWSRLNELVAGARDNVRAAFEAATRVEGDDGAAAVSPACTWTSADLEALDRNALRTVSSNSSIADGEAIGPAGSILFDALMGTSFDAEFMRHDADEAARLVEDALTKETDAAGRARARLRAIQLRASLDQHAAVVEHARHARDEIEPALTTNGTSTVVLAVLAALSSVPADERVAFAEPLVQHWTDGALIFPDETPRLVETSSDTGTRFTLSDAPVEAALRERLFAACSSSADWNARFEDFDRRRAVGALRALAGRLPAEVRNTTHWTFLDAGPLLLAVHADASGRCVGQLVDRERFASELGLEINKAHALPSGFVLDLGGTEASAGEPVGIPMELAPAIPRATLRHPDVAAVLRRAESRTAWMRAGMVVLALFVGGAALTMHFALRRERRLVEARASFVAGVSHELRTPLASILLMAENLESGHAGANTSRYHLLIRREALRLRRLVDDVLDFSRLERGRRFDPRVEDVETAAWFEVLAEEARGLGAAAGVEVECTQRDLPSHIAFDGEAVRRAVLNLVVNALRHSGSARIEVSATAEPGDVLLVTVADHGQGIPVREREAIFEPFARLAGSETTPGAGLGLAIVREIALAHDGSASVRDRDSGPGAVFELRIRAPGERAPDSAPAAERSSIDPRTGTVRTEGHTT